MVTDRFLFDGADSLCARTACRAVRTSGSAKVEKSAGFVKVPSSPASQHRRLGKVNPGESRFVVAAGHDSAGCGWHDCGDREGSIDSVGWMRAVCCAGSPPRSLAHSRYCRDRSMSRLAPGCGSARRGTGAWLHLPVCLRHTDVDEGHRWWDTAPAYVPRHVVGRGAETNCQVVIGAVPVINEDRHLEHLLRLSV